MTYMLVDCAWVVWQPTCVKEPGPIITHHIVTALFLLVPLFHERYALLMAINLLVEINTFLLIAKRHVKSAVLEALFYSTWVTMRLIAYPYLAVHYTRTYFLHSEEMGTRANIVAIAPVIQSYLSCLNFYWTATMLRQMLAKRSARGRAGRAPPAKKLAEGERLPARSSNTDADVTVRLSASADAPGLARRAPHHKAQA